MMTAPPRLPAALPPSTRDVAIDAEETVWHGRFPLQRVQFRQRRFDGTMSARRTWELWRRGAAAGLLPYDPVADAVVLIEQFRLPAVAAGIDPVMVEVPAGLSDPGEDTATTMRREAQEEVGLEPGRVVHIGDFMLSPGGSDELLALYVGEVTAPPSDAAGIAGEGGLAAEDEDIRIRVWPAGRAIAAALAGSFPNVVTTLALLWLAHRRDGLRRDWGAA